MKKSLFLLLMILSMGLAAFFWQNTRVVGLPWAVIPYDVGRLLALLGFVLILFQYLLRSRIQWMENGIGPARLISWHKILGVVVLGITSAHPLLLLLSERLQGYSTPLGLWKIVGLLTLLLIWVVAGAALLSRRFSIPYKKWTRIHRAAYLILPLAFIHSMFLGTTLQRTPLRGFWFVMGMVYLAVLVHRIRRSFGKGKGMH